MSDAKLLIVGQGAILRRAADVAAQLDLAYTTLALEGAYDFDLSSVAAYSPDTHDVFVAFDYRALNYIRLRLISNLTQLGYRLSKLLSPHAMLARDLRIAPGVLIEAGAVIGSGTSLDLGCIVGAGTLIGTDCQIGKLAWLGAGCNIGHAVQVGVHSTVEAGVMLADKTEVGSDSEIITRGCYQGKMERGTFISPTYPDEPVRILTP